MRRAAFVIALSACASSKPAPVAPAPAPAPAPSGTASSVELLPAGTGASTGDDETALNAKRWLYAAYFTRLKHTVAASWDPARVWKALPDTTRTTLGTATRETMLEIEIADDGRLVKVGVLKPSGAAELDAEAIRAFQINSPFNAWPNRKSAGPFKFSFFFEVGGASSIRVSP